MSDTKALIERLEAATGAEAFGNPIPDFGWDDLAKRLDALKARTDA